MNRIEHVFIGVIFGAIAFVVMVYGFTMPRKRSRRRK